jgi:hypothetical protein
VRLVAVFGRPLIGTVIAAAAVFALVSCASGPSAGSASGAAGSWSAADPFATTSPWIRPSGSASPSPGAKPTKPAKKPTTSSRPAGPPIDPVTGRAELPRGGTSLFPRYRLVGYSGGEASRAFGRLGIGNLDKRIAEMDRAGRAYTKGGRQPLPVLELITVIVQAGPGRDGEYRSRIDNAQIARYLAAARRHKALLLLNIQPGRADFLAEVKALQRWLVEPDVGIALDPEWAIGKHQVPGHVFGRTTATELNAVAAYLSAFTVAHGLPEKAMVVHQLAPRIIHRVQDIKRHPGVEMVLSVDGIGARKAKVATWRRLVKPLPPAVHPGFKLFFEEDRAHGKLMTPAQVMALTPTPDYVLYE